jgi:hypothetical protein
MLPFRPPADQLYPRQRGPSPNGFRPFRPSRSDRSTLAVGFNPRLTNRNTLRRGATLELRHRYATQWIDADIRGSNPTAGIGCRYATGRRAELPKSTSSRPTTDARRHVTIPVTYVTRIVAGRASFRRWRRNYLCYVRNRDGCYGGACAAWVVDGEAMRVGEGWSW